MKTERIKFPFFVNFFFPKKVTNWLVTEILKSPKEKKKENLKKIILIAEELYNLKNYQSLMSVVAALSTTLVERLEVWKVEKETEEKRNY